MGSESSGRTHRLEIGDETYELGSGQFRSSLCDIVTALLIEREASRATFLLSGPEGQLDDLSAHLYRHLKQQRCSGPPYDEWEGVAHSFRIHSVIDALVAVHFFLHAGDRVPHFFVGHGHRDSLACIERGSRTRVHVESRDLLSRLQSLVYRN